MAVEGEAELQVLDTLFQSYAAACRAAGGIDAGGDDAYEEGVERVKEYLLSSAGDAAICMVCLDEIRHADAVWSCQDSCYAVMHLQCVQSWARRALATVQEKAAGQQLDPRLFPGAQKKPEGSGWGCPKCRQEYREVPGGYSCWCGKLPDPVFDPWRAAHSCGERCERPAPGCGHPCMLLCHPGPCPPCPLVISASCHCGAVVTDKRCGRHEFSCGGVCDAPLPCGHTCPTVCHDGDCPPCAIVSTVSCRCGAESAELPCSQQGVYQCSRVCGKLLGCGRHRCEQVCHSGVCGECKLAGPKACPCGKHQLPNAACDVEVPPCGETCGKLLSCGVHTCHERCHTGPCTTVCREQVERSCECGKTSRVVQCHERFRCERRCTNMRSCGKHPCRRRCCDGVSCPPCDEVCNKWLKCRNHRCPAPCHSGPCGPCPLSARISCACGKTHYSVPCGRESTAKPPLCTHSCPVPLLCRHAPALPPHRCHFGPCPACPAPGCGMQQACGHPCSSTHCHDPPPPAVPDYQPPPPPAAPVGPAAAGSSSRSGGSSSGSGRQKDGQQVLPPAQATAAEARRLLEVLPRTLGGHLSACPACPVPVPVTCLGGHTTNQVACSQAAPFACEQPCGRPLACGNHQCASGCHDPAAVSCTPCALSCQRQRQTCAHPCPLPCHPPSTPCPPCSLSVSRPCHCSKTSLEFKCCEVTAATLPAERLCCGKVCHRALPGCPHTCEQQCHAGDCSSQGCRQEVTVRCGCKRLKKKLPCSEVQQLLLEATGSAAYDSSTQLRLLPCDAACAKPEPAGRKGGEDLAAATGAASKVQASNAAAQHKAADAAEASGPAAAAAAGGEQQQQPKRKLTRQEREAERELQRQLKEAAARRRQIRQLVVLVVVLVVTLLLGLGVRQALLSADVWLQKYAGWGEEGMPPPPPPPDPFGQWQEL